MQVLWNIVLAVQLVTAVTMIGLVLIQHGKGADMGASFGSGASGSLFGATGSANFLSRSTAACATLFFICTLGLAYLGYDRPAAAESSVLDRPAAVLVEPAASSAGALVRGAASAPALASPAAAAASGAAAIPTK